MEKETHYPLMNLDGNLMAGVLHEPVCASNTLAILLHEWTGSKEQTAVKQAAIEISRAGYAAYRVDISGNGDSEGRFEDSTPSKWLRDIVATVQHFRTRYRRIVLIGFSLGGMMSLIAATRIGVDGIVSVAAPMHPAEFDKRLTPQQYRELLSVGFTIITKRRSFGDVPYTITERFVQEMKQALPLDAARELRCPVLIVHGTDDRIVPLSDSEELFSALAAKDILVVGGADHGFKNPAHLDAVVFGIIEWLEKLR